jgi:ABC-type sugar transport system permease subunit
MTPRLILLALVEVVAVSAVVLNAIAYRDPDRNRLTRFLHSRYTGAVSNPSRRFSVFRATRSVALVQVVVGALVALLVAIALAAGWAR